MYPRKAAMLKSLTILFVLALALSACSKKTKPGALTDPAADAASSATLASLSANPSSAPGSSVPSDPSQFATGGPNAASQASNASNAAANASGLAQAAALRAQGKPVAELKMINFDLDKSDLRPDATAILDANSEWMKANLNAQIQIEGHCDERGTPEYNLALGQRRADTVREYLVSKGVDAARLHTISYGKERPLSTEDTDAAHATNRRAQFLTY